MKSSSHGPGYMAVDITEVRWNLLWKAFLLQKLRHMYWIFGTVRFKRTVYTFVMLLTQCFCYLNDELSKYSTCGKESKHQKGRCVEVRKGSIYFLG
jgi:hypothetical protein